MGLFAKKSRRRPYRRRMVSISEFDARRHVTSRLDFLRSRRMLVLAVAAVMVYLVVLSQLGLWRSWELWRLRNDLRAQKMALTAEVVELDTRKRLLESDTLYIEKIARTEYHLSRPDEIIYELDAGTDDKSP